MDERRRRLLRSFEAAPDEGAALELVATGARAADDEGFVAGLRYLADIARWDGLARDARVALGELIAAAHPGLRFQRLTHYFLGQVSHEVLVFESDEDPAWMAAVAGRRDPRWSARIEYVFGPGLGPPPEPDDDSGPYQATLRARDWLAWEPRPAIEWVLIPGGRVRLGWAGDLARAFRRWGPEVDEVLHQEWVQRARARIRPPGEVELSPFLIERRPPPRLGADYLAAGGPPPDAAAEAALAAIEAGLAGEGARLPTLDEWEHACGGGATTLFRWGDLWPTTSPAVTTFDGHLVPNAYGLQYADEASLELVSGPPCLKSGTASVWVGDVDWGDWSHAITSARPTPPPAAPLAFAHARLRRVRALCD
ncbi:MAG: hypothetical protein AB7N76_27245 [Planctomycetota bacterium]